MDIQVFVATHKHYIMPNDSLYTPIHVGASLNPDLNLGYIKDNTGDNISIKNKNFCELTALYWIWKNVQCDYIGLVHYRRYFGKKALFSHNLFNSIYTKDKMIQLLESSKGIDIFLPSQRNYYIESNYNQYIHAHNAIDLRITKQVISEKYPTFLNSFDKIMKSTKGHRFNMMIMSKTLLDDYCKWLFDILFEIEKRLDISSYSDYDKRVFGFISERLLDVWLDGNNYNYKDIPYVFLEKENWPLKIYNFLKRKFCRKE